jgi:hypothetical protein
VWYWGAGDSRDDGCEECKVDEDVEGCGGASVVRMVWWRVM